MAQTRRKTRRTLDDWEADQRRKQPKSDKAPAAPTEPQPQPEPAPGPESTEPDPTEPTGQGGQGPIRNSFGAIDV